jgi:flap endonuclease-1
MGVVLTPIITKDTIALDALRGRTLAVDGNGELYQFLALIRLRDGTPLRDSKGRTMSHLSGLFYRSTRLMADHGVRLAFVFDGEPPPLKAREIAKRLAGRQRYEEEPAAALARGDVATADSKATMTSRLTREMVAEARQLLQLMEIPTVQARPRARRRPRTWPQPRIRSGRPMSGSARATASTPRSSARFATGSSGDRRPRDELPRNRR